MTSTPVYPQTLNNGYLQILPADTTTKKTAFTAGANGSLIDMIIISSTDTTARDIAFYITNSAVDYLLATISIPANSGNTNAISLLTVLDQARFGTMLSDVNGNRVLRLKTGDTLRVAMASTVTTAKVTNVLTLGGDF